MIRCIDVSRWQGVIDWNKVKQSGIRGAWIKVGGADGGLYRDSRSQANLAGVEAADMPYGTYYFCSPAPGDAVRQARHAHTCGHGMGVLPPGLDLEIHNGLSGPQLDQFAREFCDETFRLTGRESAIYTGAWIGVTGSNSFFGYTDHTLGHCHLWIANYGKNVAGTQPTASSPPVPAVWASRGWSAWQFNSATSVPGIESGSVDQDVVTEEAWAEFTGGTAMTPTNFAEEWAMRAIMLEGQEVQYRIVTDGFGRDRRTPIPSLAYKANLIGAGVIDGPIDNVHVISDAEERAAFESIPESNATYTADVGSLALAGETIRQVNEFTAKSVAEVPGVVPLAPVDADAIVDEIAQRLKD